MNNRYFYIKDVDCTITIEYATRKEMLEMIDNYVENCKTRDEMIANNNPNACYYDMSQDAFAILYKDGTVDIIDESYDGHHVKRQHIVSITNENPSTIIVFGHFGLNECGVAEPTSCDEIDESLKEVNTDNYKETTDNTNNEESGNETTDSTNKDKVTVNLGSLDDIKIDLSQESNKTPAELKDDINKKYGVNAVYYDTDSILCDDKKQNVYVAQHNTKDNEVYATTTKIIIRDVCDNEEICTITPYENGKELTTPINKMKCLTCVIDYVKRLYDLNVVTRDTYFTISRVGKRNTVLTYTNTHNIVQYYNISEQMQTLATTAIEQYGYYSKYTRKPLKSRQYDVLELYKKGIYLTISQCNDSENVIKDWYCDIIYKSAHHIGQYTYVELLHLIDIIRYNTQEYCDKYFD